MACWIESYPLNGLLSTYAPAVSLLVSLSQLPSATSILVAVLRLTLTFIMDSPTVLTVVAAIAVHSIVSPISEFPTELYIVPYIIANLLIVLYLLARSMTYPTIFTTLLSTNTTFLLTSALLTIVRRLFFSPLTRYPGPKLAAISGLWNANEARLGRASRTHKALHEKYNSDVIRIGPNELSINNADALDKLYGGKYIRGTFNQVFNIAGGNNLATLREHEKHSAWKRMW